MKTWNIHDFEANLPEQCLECNSIAELNNRSALGRNRGDHTSCADNHG